MAAKTNVLSRLLNGLSSRLNGGAAQYKEIPLLWADWRTDRPMWLLTDYGSYVEEGFEANPLIYSAVAYKMRAASQARMRAWQGDAERPKPAPPGHPLSLLASRPNEHQSWNEFQSIQTGYLNITGNAYALIDRKNGAGKPTSIFPLNPTLVRIIPGGDNRIKGYLYSPDGIDSTRRVPILAEDMIHVKFPSLSDPLAGLGYGMSPLTAMAISGDLENYMSTFLRNFLKSGAMLGGLLKFDVPLEQSDMDRIRARWREIYGGVENWGDVGIIDVNGHYERMIPSFKDMSLDVIDDRTETRILGPFGVPGILINAKYSLSRSTFANYAEARTAFWEDTMLYELALFEADYQFQINFDDAFLAWDLSGVPALRADNVPLIDGAVKLWNIGVPARNAFAAVGLKIESYPGDDKSYIPVGMIEAGTAGAPPARPGALPAANPDDAPVNADDETDGQRARRGLSVVKGVKKNGQSMTANG